MPSWKLSSLLHISGTSWRYFKTASRKKKIAIISVFIVLTIILFSALKANQTPKYQTAVVQKSDIKELVTETGSITSNGKIDVYSPTNGVIEEIYVANGEYVEKGQELFRVESSATEQERSQALANYLAAKSALDTANATLLSLQSSMFANWDTYKELAESDTYENPDGSPKNEQRTLPEYQVAEKDWLASEKNYQKQRSVISQAQAAVTSANLQYQATLNSVVKATANGTVANLAHAVGSTVRISLPTAPIPPVLSLASTSTTEAAVQLSESDVAKVQVGQPAVLDIGDISDKGYKGVVVRVDSIGTDVQGVVRYNAYIQLTNPDGLLRPGMTADIEITTKSLSQVLSVPNAAIKPYQGGKAVRVFDSQSNKMVYVPVRIGVRGKEKTQILSGIEEGKSVITALPNDQLKRPGLFSN